MYSVVASRLCYVITIFTQRRPLLHNSTIHRRASQKDHYSTKYTKLIANMTTRCFDGRNDNYNGVTVHSTEEPCETAAFLDCLKASLAEWSKQKKHAIWFCVHLLHAEWIPILVRQGFKFHNAREEYVTLYRCLRNDKECNIPPYAHTNLGIGAFVYNDKTEEILVVKEKHSRILPMWKLPGGYVEPRENIEEAIQREVFEETGIRSNFECLISFRHTHDHAFDCSDMYMISYLSPSTFDIKKCEQEISECKWMKLHEYAEHPEVHENNRTVARKMIEFLKHRIGLSVNHGFHPITKKPICVYSLSEIRIENSFPTL